MEWKGIKGVVLKEVPMKRYTSMKVGGQAAYLAYPADEADLAAALQFVKDEGMRYRFLGNGTNVIVSDRGLNAALDQDYEDETYTLYEDKRRRRGRCIGRGVIEGFH